MIWLNPAAWAALIAVAAPILIHILVQRRAKRTMFPTLRFVEPTRLAAIRRHLLEDFLLLAINQLVNMVSTFSYSTRGQVKVPLVIRAVSAR